jgi:hypothetical protein
MSRGMLIRVHPVRLVYLLTPKQPAKKRQSGIDDEHPKQNCPGEDKGRILARGEKC